MISRDQFFFSMATFEQAEVAVAVAVAATPGADVVCVVIDVYRMLSTVKCVVFCFVGF